MGVTFVTGCAGFVGFHLCRRLLDEGENVVGADSVCGAYDPALKEARLAQLCNTRAFEFHKIDIAAPSFTELLKSSAPSRVVNLAAQPGVRYSLTNPQAYIESNVVGFLNVLEACRASKPDHFVFASSSSIYGLNSSVPFSEHDGTDHPTSIYAATKKANEMMAHSYSHLFGIPTTGLRFFSVYGPWGRPDMAPYLFTKAIIEGKPIDVFNHGKCSRDFTYVDDIVEGVVRVLRQPPRPNPAWDACNADPASSSAPYKLYNIGNHKPVTTLELIVAIEHSTGLKAQINLVPAQPGDVESTFASIDDLKVDTGFSPDTSIEVGITRFVDWFKSYHRQ